MGWFGGGVMGEALVFVGDCCKLNVLVNRTFS